MVIEVNTSKKETNQSFEGSFFYIWLYFDDVFYLGGWRIFLATQCGTQFATKHGKVPKVDTVLWNLVDFQKLRIEKITRGEMRRVWQYSARYDRWVIWIAQRLY